ncbi:MAG: hypothetical protein ACRCSQ_05640 [Bacteroidales bacterium]
MFKIQVIPAHEQATTAMRIFEEKPDQKEDATIHGGTFGFLSWAYVTEDLFFPLHRDGAMDLFIYSVTQSHESGDKIEDAGRVKAGDVVVMQSGVTHKALAKRIGTGFSAFEFWFSESGILQGGEQASFMKIHAHQFPVMSENDVVIRQLYGNEAPIMNINGMKITEIMIPPGATFDYPVFADRKIGIYVVQGNGIVGNHAYISGDFLSIWQWDDRVDGLVVRGEGELASRLILIDIEDLND